MERIVKLGPQGAGITESGEPVSFALPGELADTHGHIEEPSAERVQPPCPHFGICGGCQMQHASDALVAEWKTDLVRTPLAHRGIEALICAVETSPPLSRRRAKLSGRRTKTGALVGFHGYRTHQIVEVPECRILTPRLTAVMPALRELTREIGSRKGEVSYQTTETLNGVDLHVSGGKPLTGEMRIRLAAFAEEAGLARLTYEDEPIVTRLAPVQQMGRAQVAPPPGAFLQATAEGEAALLAATKAAIGPVRKVVDLFAGCGTFSLPLAETAEVHAVETYQPMLWALDKGWRKAEGLKKVTTEVRDLFRNPLYPDELNGFDAAVIDPPRAGAEAQIRQIAESKLGSVAMVSCNPVTFARDVSILLEAGFVMGPITVVDQFRWSSHVELAAHLTRS